MVMPSLEATVKPVGAVTRSKRVLASASVLRVLPALPCRYALIVANVVRRRVVAIVDGSAFRSTAGDVLVKARGT